MQPNSPSKVKMHAMIALGTLTLDSFPAGGKEGLPEILASRGPSTDAQNQGGHTAAFRHHSLTRKLYTGTIH